LSFTRRNVLQIGGFILAGLPFFDAHAAVAETADIIMRGNADGSKVWFEPRGLLVRPGQIVRWTNKDSGNAHTSTAYHPQNDDHPLRIPAGAEPWNSDYLLPHQSFSIVLSVPGVYDYFCIPHEMAGMVGRIVVAADKVPSLPPYGGDVPEVADFPSVQDIISKGRILR
jgi:plastocyanin